MLPLHTESDHLDKNSQPYTIQAEHVLKLLRCHLASSVLHHRHTTELRIPVEYDILSVEFLKTKFTSSFQAENPIRMTSDRTSESAALTTGVAKNSADRCGVPKLHEVPVVLVGCLKPSSSSVSGGLVLQDLTGEIDCEVS